MNMTALIQRNTAKEENNLYLFEGIAGTKDIDSYGTIIDFNTLEEATPLLPIYLEHNYNTTPVGTVLDIKRTEDNMTIKGGINKRPYQNVVDDIKEGRLNYLSLAGICEKQEGNVLSEGVLLEISLTNNPSNKSARIYKRVKQASNLDELFSIYKDLFFYEFLGMPKADSQWLYALYETGKEIQKKLNKNLQKINLKNFFENYYINVRQKLINEGLTLEEVQTIYSNCYLGLDELLDRSTDLLEYFNL